MKRILRRPVSIIGVRLDLGAGRRGTDMGPSAVRIAGLHDALRRAGFHDIQDLGDLAPPTLETIEDTNPSARCLEPITAICRRLAKEVRGVLEAGRVPVVIGGDHSCAIGTISGVVAHYRRERRPVGVIWIDAHGDMNTPESSPSGNIHGMPLAVLLGHGPEALTELAGRGPKLSPERVALVGIRDLDYTEREIVQKSGVRVFTMTDIDEHGIASVMRDAIQVARGSGDDGLYHVSFDLDGIDPQFAPGVGTAVEGGLTYREAHMAMELVAASGGLVAVEMVEINPILDESNRTGRLAMELLLSALGKRIFVH